ncbi:MAG: choice-of-anchor J domain-containing protein [Bacteroidales bacterium]|nr:choice-of-anchor J domain-containing protein [Bacteroidales bacterium]
MKRSITIRSIFIMLLAVLLNSMTYAQPEGDFLAVIGSAGDVKRIVLFNFEDGTLADDLFLDLTPLDVGTVKQVVRVEDELWVSDQTKDCVYRFDLEGTYISTIGGGAGGGLDNLRGLRQLGNEVWLANAGTQNGAPGYAIVRIGLDGQILGNFPVGGSPWAFWPFTNDNILISFSSVTGFLSQIAIFDQSGTLIAPFNLPGELNFIQQISETQNGDFLASAFSNATGGYANGVHRYNAQGAYLQVIGGTSGTGPRGCWELGNGNIMWTNGAGIHIADVTSGTSQVVYAGSFQFVEKITFGGGAVELPFSENFESLPPEGWEAYNVDGGGEEWGPSTAQNHTPGGTTSAFHDFGLSGYMEDGWMVTPAINLPEFYSVQLSFWSYNLWPTYYFKNSVLVSTGSGNPADGDFIEVWAATAVTSEWEQTEIDLSNYAGNAVYIAFRYEGDDAHAWHLDDVMVDGSAPVLDPPSNLQATVAVNDVTLTWDAPASKELLGYKVYRDEVLITPAPVTQTTYLDVSVLPGTHIYGVSAVYNSGESEKAGPVQVLIEGGVGKIHGFVRDAVTNYTIDAATVTASNADNGALTIMTPFGAYYSLLLPAGTYDVTCTADGYEPFTAENLLVIENVNKGYTFYLQPLPVDQLTGISTNDQSRFDLYPNPASGAFTITGAGLQEIQILNQAGLVVYHEQLKDFSTVIDVAKIPSGLYFIKVKTNEGTSVEKLIIN